MILKYGTLIFCCSKEGHKEGKPTSTDSEQVNSMLSNVSKYSGKNYDKNIVASL